LRVNFNRKLALFLFLEDLSPAFAKHPVGFPEGKGACRAMGLVIFHSYISPAGIRAVEVYAILYFSLAAVGLRCGVKEAGQVPAGNRSFVIGFDP
jgi:hypothetical protein